MITSYEVGTIFKIVDRASPVISELTRMMYRLEETTTITKKNLESMGKLGLGNLRRGMSALTDQAIRMDKAYKDALLNIQAGTDKSAAQTRIFANEWRSVAAAARQAQIAIAATGRATAATTYIGPWGAIPGPAPRGRIPSSGVPIVPRSPSGRGRGGSSFGGTTFGVHSRNQVNLPGNTHLGVYGHGVAGNAALAGAGLLGYSIYEEAQIEDIAARALLTGQIKVDEGMRDTDAFKRIRDVIRKNAAKTGFSPKEVGESVLKTERMFGGLDFNKRLAIEDTILPYAALDARMKESGLGETFEAMVGMIHQSGIYDVKKLPEMMRQFSYASLITPASPSQFRTALGYSQPILSGGMGMDSGALMFLTAMTQSAGIMNTKSGTWIRTFFERLMPQTGINATRNSPKHNSKLINMGLLDENLNPTWMVKGAGGKTDWFESVIKLAETMNTSLSKMSDKDRLQSLSQVFGERGGGEGALMNLKEFIQQFPLLIAKMKEFKGGDSGLFEYLAGSPVQQGRTAWADLQNVLLDIGTIALPPVITALRGFDDVLNQIAKPLGYIVDHMPKEGNFGGLPKKGTFGDALGKGMLTGGLVGAAAGWWSGPGVAVSSAFGALLGGAATGGAWLANQYLPFGTGNPGDGPAPGTVKPVIIPGAVAPVGPDTTLFHKSSFLTPGGRDSSLFKFASYTSEDGSIPAHAMPIMFSGGGGGGGGFGGGGGGGGPMGNTGPSPDDIALSGLAGNEYVKGMRAGFAGELKNPALRLKMAAMLATEGSGVLTAESVMNRANYSHKSLAAMLSPAFYGPMRNPAAFSAVIARLSRNPKEMAKYNAIIDAALNGSNVLHGYTDQGMWNDPNGPGSRIRKYGSAGPYMKAPGGGNYYNDWAGGPGGYAGARKWREDFEGHARQSSAVHPAPKDQANLTPVILQLDGRVIARSTMREITKLGQGPARGPRLADPTSTRPISV